MVFDGFGGFGCLLVVLVALAVAGKAPGGSLCHHILMVFGGFGGFVCFFNGFGGFGRCWQGPLEHPLPSDHQFLIWLFLVVLVVLAVAGRASWGTPYHHILILFGGFGGFGRRCPLPFP